MHHRFKSFAPQKKLPFGSSFFSNILRYHNHACVQAVGHFLTIFADKAYPGVHIVPAKISRVQAVGLRAPACTARSVNAHVELIDDADNIPDEFEKYWQEQKILALNKLCEDEHLDKEQFKALIDAYIFSGQDPIRDEVLKCLGNRPSILQARAIGERVIFKMKEFVEVFEKGMVA